MRAVRASSSPAGSSASSSAGRVRERGAGRDALLLAARERRGRVVGAIRRVPSPSSSASARRRRSRGGTPAERQRQRDVLGAGERGGERARVVLVEEAEPLGAERRGAPRAQAHDVDAERAREPADGRSKPAAMRSSVLLPEPLGPSTTQRSPCATESVSPAGRRRPSRCPRGCGRRRAARVRACRSSAHCSPVTPRPADAAAVGDAQRRLDERRGEQREQRRRRPRS